MGDVRDLVGEHCLELLVAEATHDPCGGAYDGGLGASPGGEGIGHVGVGDGDAGLRHVGHGAEAIDHGVQLRGFLGCHDSAAHAEEGDLVGEPVLAEDHR